jgi:hypothetical protein
MNLGESLRTVQYIHSLRYWERNALAAHSAMFTCCTKIHVCNPCACDDAVKHTCYYAKAVSTRRADASCTRRPVNLSTCGITTNSRACETRSTTQGGLAVQDKALALQQYTIADVPTDCRSAWAVHIQSIYTSTDECKRTNIRRAYHRVHTPQIARSNKIVNSLCTFKMHSECAIGAFCGGCIADR